jgi:hypothetical protein
LEGGDEEAADETEDKDVAPHDGVVKKYNGDGEEVVSPGEKTEGPRRDALALGTEKRPRVREPPRHSPPFAELQIPVAMPTSG